MQFNNKQENQKIDHVYVMELTNNKLNLKYIFYYLTFWPSNPRGHLQITATKFKIKIF